MPHEKVIWRNSYELFNRIRLINLIIIGVIILGYGYLFFTSFPDAENSTCVFKRITTIPCPGCGMGRSTWSLMRGHVAQSLFYHPLGIIFNLFMIAAVLQAVIDVLKNDDKLIRMLKKPWPTWGIILFVVVILLVWARNIWVEM